MAVKISKQEKKENVVKDLKDLNKATGNSFIELKVAKYYPENTINYKLNPDAPHKFKSILGDTYSLGNGMKYFGFEDFKLAWVSKSLSNHENMIIKKSSRRDMPNYWNVVTLLLHDRLLQDRELLQQMNEELAGDLIRKTSFIPYLKIKRGIIIDEIPNDKLRIYGRLLNSHGKRIIYRIREELGENNDIRELPDDAWDDFTTMLKKEYVDIMLDHLKSPNLMDGINVEVTNEEIIDAFMKSHLGHNVSSEEE